ncbi:MAG TPA: DUF4340 domain-containing protein [Candidatus Saccharimonadales bacterium]|nr:DUF4340 domain-containing protein [Candidatus Saccharimonadales bacterium]
MNRKQLTILIVVGVVIGVLGIVAYKRQNESWNNTGTRMGAKVIEKFPMNDVERLSIRQGSNQLNLAKKNEIWVVEERGDYPANFDTIRDFLQKVGEVKVAQAPQVGQSQLARLELSASDKSTNSGTQVEFKDKSGKQINTLMLGKKHMKESKGDSQFGGGGFPDGRYVMVGSDAKTVAVTSEAFANIEPKPEEWLSKDFFKVENLKTIAVTSQNASNNWKLFREKEGADWKLADPKKEEQVENTKTTVMSSALSSPSFNDVSTESAEKTGLDKPTLTAKLETFDGFNYDVKVGKKVSDDKDDYFFKVAITGDIQKDRVPGKDEKPEDKTKLDKEQADKAAKLQEKLKSEKAFEKWTYVVSKWTVDPLFKERKDFLAEKKEEPKVADKAPAAPSPTVITPPTAATTK